MREEELDSTVRELLELARERGRELKRQRGGDDETPVEKPDISDVLTQELRSSLEDEVVLATESSSGEINKYELRHEIVKKALIGLKLSALREVARDHGLAVSGAAEEVATRVASACSWDADEVARLVLAYEEEPSPERGHVDRLFPLRERPDLDYVRERLSYVAGRYVRVGVARWFVFEAIGPRHESGVSISGSYHSYRTTVDEVEGKAHLTPVPSRKHTRVRIEPAPVLMVHGATSQTARAAAQAMQLAAKVELLRYVPFTGAQSQGGRSGLHPTSELMLDLLVNRFRRSGLGNLDLTVARFKVETEAKRDNADREDEASRPALRAVRFEGRHLLDSVEACRLLSKEQRPLVDMVLDVSRRTKSGSLQGRFPLKVVLESDHVMVATGYGTGQPELSLEVQRQAVEAVAASLEYGLMDRDEVDAYAARISELALAERPPERATMLTEEDGQEED